MNEISTNATATADEVQSKPLTQEEEGLFRQRVLKNPSLDTALNEGEKAELAKLRSVVVKTKAQQARFDYLDIRSTI